MHIATSASCEAVLSDFARNLECTTSLDMAMDVLQDAGEKLGYPLVDYASMPTARRLDGTWMPPYFLTRRFPRGWDRNYEKHRPNDPYFHACFAQSGVLSWSEVRARFAELTSAERDCMNYICDLGLTRGLTVPIHLPGLRFAFVSLITDTSTGADEDASQALTNGVFLLAHYFHNTVSARFRYRQRDTTSQLSGREAECLTWCAEGKTVEDIGMLLGLSSETVRIYLKRANIKLNALNRPHAVAKAIHLGLIDPPRVGILHDELREDGSD